MTTVAYSAISSYSRVEILHLLQDRPQRTIAELCEATGLHANTIREHLQRLIDGGYVVPQTERRTTRGRPRVLYSAAGTGAGSSPVARRKVAEAARRGDLMRRVLRVGNGGPLAPDAVHQLDALVEDLSAAGFDPLVDEDELTVDLTPCTHAAADDEGRRSMRCAVHLNLMQSVLAEAGGPLAVDGMRPSCDPTQCVVQLIARR
ncbi:ArsR family transcriptional regulator [Microbacterium sp. RU33B]|uniref:ArsR family transcriptional regulator n=1 Tax=Microbacterium sp. RU33B TaxID=1907390 RepID=UPI000966BE22|nr:ArsR family transcriptional regulator [Microbacterium sp. RU33B]SIT68955.1 Predicted transcriptional regulator, ArsR family [Microbacterium sp. RU33B]